MPPNTSCLKVMKVAIYYDIFQMLHVAISSPGAKRGKHFMSGLLPH